MSIVDVPVESTGALQAGRREVRRELLRELLHSPMFMIGAIVLLFWIVCAIFGPTIAPHDPLAQNLEAINRSPSCSHWFGIDQLGIDVRATPEPGHGGIRSSVIVTADRPEDVDALVRRAQAAGATVTKEPTDAEFFEGRDAYFADPEGNYWEVAWAAEDNPVTAAARRAAGIATDIQSE